MTTAFPRVALVIVAYNHARHLPATLHAIQQLGYPADRRCTIVVDNGDGSSADVARGTENVQVIEPGRNLGFAGGCNAAVAATDADVIALINPDLQPLHNFLDHLVAPLSDPSIGLVGAKLLYPDHRTIQHAGGFVQRPTLLAQHHGYGESDHGQYDTPRDVEFVTGAALALRRATWNALGGLDDSFYPAYYEDVDLGWRVRQHGLRAQYEPRAVALHHEAAGLGKHSAAYQQLYHRNRLRLLFKHFDDDWLLREWLPAELDHLRATADDAEITGLQAAYLEWQAAFLHKNMEQAAPNGVAIAEAQRLSSSRQHMPELEWTLQQVDRKRIIVPQPFQSRWPLVARLRTWFSRVVTEEYMRPIIQQQNDYNAAVAELGAALARQRRTTDAAIACQALLLAKLMNQSAHNRE